jgi:phosphate-selective porin
VSGSWIATGERKAGGVEPRRPLLAGGFGALEVAIRYERVRFGADDPAEPPEANPRAGNLVETGNGAWTLGANWYVNRWSRIQFNAIRESFDDIERSPVSGRSSYWSGMCRLQFVL